MKIHNSTFDTQRPTPNGVWRTVPFDVECSQRGSVLIIVLWVCIGLVAISLYFANSMTYELRASDNRASGLATDQSIVCAARYVSTLLTI